MDIRSLSTVARFLGLPETATSGDVIGEICRRENTLRDAVQAAEVKGADRLEGGVNDLKAAMVKTARLERELSAAESALSRARAQRDNLECEVADLRRCAAGETAAVRRRSRSFDPFVSGEV